MKTKKVVSVLLISLLLIPTLMTWFSPPMHAREIKPNTAEYFMNEGLFYLSSGKFDEAEIRLLQALKKNPTIIDALYGLGIVYLNKREFRKSIDYFQQVVKINSLNYDAYNFLGVAYTELSEYNLAKENLLIAANADKYRTPENAYVNLAMLEIRQNRYDAAMRYVDKGLDKNARFAPLYNVRGVILENQDKLSDAIASYERGLTLLTEEDASYLLNIARVYIKLNQKEKAQDMLEKALPRAYNEEMKDKIREMLKGLEKNQG
ncbi:MAG: tetratricopeptide repeat protein [Candidatus Omnitrophota bacterium]